MLLEPRRDLSRDARGLSMTHGPAIRKSGPPPRQRAPEADGSQQRPLAHERATGTAASARTREARARELVLEARAHEVREERVRSERLAT